MISPKPLLSENAKDFIDYALDVIKTMDGAPEHNLEAQEVVNQKLAKLKDYIDVLAASYHETVPKVSENPVDTNTAQFSGTGHS